MVSDNDIRMSDDNKAYVIRGREYARMTRVLEVGVPKPYLEKWRERVGDEEADRIVRETSDAGSLVHLVTELYDMGDIPGVKTVIAKNQWLTPYLFVWMEWRGAYTIGVKMIERVVWSERLGIAGRLDKILMMVGDESPALVDVKTTKVLSDSIGIQLCGYREMVIEMIEHGELPQSVRPERTIVCHLPGPRDDDAEKGRVLERVRVKEYIPGDYLEQLEDCVSQYKALREE
jgi:hypothetical protein